MTQTVGAKILEWPLRRCACCELYVRQPTDMKFCDDCSRGLRVHSGHLVCTLHDNRRVG